MKKTVLILAGAAMLASCVQETLVEVSQSDKFEMTFSASIGTPSRTLMKEGGKVGWTANDEISVFSNGKNERFVTEQSGPVVEFTGLAEISADRFYALYPYSGTASAAGSVLKSELPSEQLAAEGTFAEDLAPAAAASTTSSLSFKNLTGLVRVVLAQDAGEVKSVSLKGNAGEKIAGNYSVDCSSSEFVMQDMDKEVITLTPASGNLKNGVEYYMAVAPVNLSQGIAIRFNYADGTSGELKSTKPAAVKRSAILSLRNIKASSPASANLSFKLAGMEGYLPDGNGRLSMTEESVGTAQHEVTVVADAVNGLTEIQFLQPLQPGTYTLESFTSPDAKVYSLHRKAAIVVSASDESLNIEGWNNDFFSFGGTSKEDPIFLDAEGLRKLRLVVTNGNSCSGVHFALSGPIDLTDPEGGNWKPVGSNAKLMFGGCFDGRNHEIRGLKIASPEYEGSGLFGFVCGESPENPAVIENVVLAANPDGTPGLDLSNAKGLAGGVCAVLVRNAVVRNCINRMAMNLSYASGCIVGVAGISSYIPWMPAEDNNVIVENCHNYGPVKVFAGAPAPNPPKHFNAGGVAGGSNGIIRRCSNRADITNGGDMTFFHVGGITGFNAGVVEECFNTGNASGNIRHVAGICGQAPAGVSLIQNCYNTGEMNAGMPSAGILASLPDSPASHLTIKHCYNAGKMYDDKDQHQGGGIISVVKVKTKYVSCQFNISTNRPGFSVSNSFEDGLNYLWSERLRGNMTAEIAVRKSTFTTDVWNAQSTRTPDWNFTDVWAIDEGVSMPYLIHNEQIPHPTFPKGI